MKLDFIKIPLYKLNYVDDIEEIILDKEFLNQFCVEYDKEERKNIFEQLDWAVNNPAYDFGSLVTVSQFSNKEIYNYIQRLHHFMLKNEIF